MTKEMIKEITWDEFRDTGMVWWVNRFLHLFGMALVVELDEDKKILRVYPSRCKFRGFNDESETKGFKNVTTYLKENIQELEKDLDE